MERISPFFADVVPFGPEYTQSACRLFQRISGHKHYSPYMRQLLLGDLRGWEWRYRPESSVRLVAVRKGEVIGHLGALLRDVQFGGNIIKGAEIIESLVQPELRGGVVLYRLAKRMREVLLERDVEFTVLFPNKYAAATVLKRATVQREACLWEKQPAGGVDVGDTEILSGKEFLDRAPPLFALRLFHNAGTRRDINWLRWRYIENPSEEYLFIGTKSKEGVAVVKMHDGDKGHMVDVAAKDRACFEELVGGAEKLLAARGASTVSSYPLNLPEYNWLSELGYQQRPWGRRMALFSTHGGFPGQELLDNWYLTMSEHSIF